MVRRMRRRRALVVSTIVLLVLATPFVPTAAAQDTPAVRLTLLSQTPWNASRNPEGRLLEIAFRADNLTDEPIDRLSVGITLYGRLISRTAFEQSLTTDPSFIADAETFPREGAIEPGASRDFALSFPLDSPGISTTQSGVYPLKVDLRSGFTSLAALRTPVIVLVREPELPLALSWTFVLDAPIAFGPSGSFTSTAVQDAVATGGRLASELTALRAVTDTEGGDALDIAVSPVLLTQLMRMRDGYRIVEDGSPVDVGPDDAGAEAASRALTDLRHIARDDEVRTTALPFAAPEVPALVAGGLARDVPVQLQRGDDLLRTALGVTPVPGVLRPPGATLDDAALRELAGSGVSTLVVGPSTIEPLAENPLGFAGAPTAALDGGALDAIVPDPAVMAALDSSVVDEDPVLGAQVMLGELASIWQEQPGVARGIALVLSEDLELPPAFFGPFVSRVAGAPWLEPMHAPEFVTAFPPTDVSSLAVAAPRHFADTYVDALRQARRRIATLRSMLVAPSPDPDRFDTMLLLAESRQFLSNPADGLAFIGAVRAGVDDILHSIRVQTPDVITLTASNGSSIPVTVRNESGEALRVEVALRSQYLRDPPSMQIELDPHESRLLTFVVDVRTTGRFVASLDVLTPGGRPLVEQTIRVRSTVYNRIALVITIAAALVLIALWLRRLLPGRSS
jgi:hypothetical protein